MCTHQTGHAGIRSLEICSFFAGEGADEWVGKLVVTEENSTDLFGRDFARDACL